MPDLRFGKRAKQTQREESMHISRRKMLALLAMASSSMPNLARAQDKDWPRLRPIRLLVGFPPGGSIDSLARTLAERLSRRLEQSIVVENRSGAAGMLAAEEAARQTPDGYTLLLIPGGPLILNPALDIFDDKSFTQIMRLTDSPILVAVSASTPFKTLGQLIDAAKLGADPISYASSGIGSLQHLLGELIARETGARFSHIPYRGGGQAVSDLVAGHVRLGMLGIAPLLPHIQAGRVRALAVSTAERVPSLPDVPTLKQAGVNLVATSWTGLAGPKNMPAPIVDRLFRELSQILKEPDVRARLEPLGLTPSPLDGAAYVAFTRSDRDLQMNIVRERNIALQ
ncbi:MAG: tripartite tricarboxylate transporter substrate binding protein [Betaproteobacteria bacterium]|nr:tripartite tricarboxylate transporter substrate binding protein [Betaproteobacteria bacterium]